MVAAYKLTFCSNHLMSTLFIQLWVMSPAYGDDGTRTHDLRLAKAALSQLSYIPVRDVPNPAGHSGPFWTRTRDLALIRGAL